MKHNYKLTTINGIKTILYPMKSVGAIKIELQIRSGSSHETDKNWGALHFLEHLTHQGTKKFTNKAEIEDFKEKYGLRTNAYTNTNRIGYWAKGPSSSLKQAIIWLNELAFNPTFPKESLEKEISVIINETKDYWDNIGNRFWNKYIRQIYGKNHPYTRNALGKPEHIKTLTINDLVKLHKKYFTAPNCYFSVTGNFKINQAEKIIKKNLKPISNKKVKFPKIPLPVAGKKKLIHHEDIKQEEILLIWPLPGFKQTKLKDRLKIGIANYILGVGPNSILNKVIREKHGLSYWVSSNRYYYDLGGHLQIATSIEPQNRKKYLKILRETIYQFINNPIDKKRFEQASKFMDHQTSLSFDSVDNINDNLINDLFAYGRPIFPEEYAKTGKKLTPQSVIKFIKKYITPDKELLSIMKAKS